MAMLLLLTALASAQEPGSVEPLVSAAFHDQLAAAKQDINRGDYEDARAILEALDTRLAGGEEPPTVIAHEALVYLGDLRFVAGEQDAAREAFRRVLLDDPDHIVSPYDHTQDVRAFFSLVREQVRAELAAIPPVPVPDPDPVLQPRTPMAPWHAYTPLGIPQFAQRRPTRGVVYGGVQLATLSASIGMYAFIARVNVPDSRHPFEWDEPTIQRNVRNLRFGVQWPATILFYAAWTASMVDAQTTWRRDHRGLTIGVGPRSIRVGGRF